MAVELSHIEVEDDIFVLEDELAKVIDRHRAQQFFALNIDNLDRKGVVFGNAEIFEVMEGEGIVEEGVQNQI